MDQKPVQSALANPVIARCCNAWHDAYNASIAKNEGHDAAWQKGRSAYRKAMPPLMGARNIRYFIACVTYGAVVGVFNNDEISRLLYAAQVAHTTRRTRKPIAKSEGASSEKSQSGAIQDGLSAIQAASSQPAQAA